MKATCRSFAFFLLLTVALRRTWALAGQGNGVLRPIKGGSGIDNVIDFCIKNPSACSVQLSKRDMKSLRLFLEFIKKRHSEEGEVDAAGSSAGHPMPGNIISEVPQGPGIPKAVNNKVGQEEVVIDSNGHLSPENLVPQQDIGRLNGVNIKGSVSLEKEKRLVNLVNRLESVVEALIKQKPLLNDLQFLSEQRKKKRTLMKEKRNV